MSTALPDLIDPRRLAERGVRLSGRIPLSELSRLCGLLVSDAGEVDVDLEFSRDERRRPRVTGHVKAELSLQCQRCLESFGFTADMAVCLGIVGSDEEARELPDGYEPLVAPEEGATRLYDLIEDELILALPQVPRHASENCSATSVLGRLSIETQAKASPFAVLAGLKEDRRKS